MMNRLKFISQRNSWCQLKRLQSSLSKANSKVQIPDRIERGPTDILQALASTVPDDPIQSNYVYHDDPYLLPLKRTDYRTYALSYEAGKKAAIWIHEEHSDLFEKHLAEPKIKAFEPFVKCTDEKEASEEMLLQAILSCRISTALNLYDLLKGNVSNEAKQSLLELLCFCTEGEGLHTELYFEQWYINNKHKIYWQHAKLIDDLYQFLIKQDPLTAAAAYSTIICGLTKCLRLDEAWVVFRKCMEAERVLNIAAYNSALLLIPKVIGKKNVTRVEYMYDILKVMNAHGIKPNIITLNAALNVVSHSRSDMYDRIIKNLLAEYRNLNIEYSLGTYHHIMVSFYKHGENSYEDFKYLMNTLKYEDLTLQDIIDLKYFSHAMSLACYFQDRDAGEKIHKLLLFGNNRKLLFGEVPKNNYYFSYLTLLLTTSKLDEFFHFYNQFCPKEYLPNSQLFTTIIDTLKLYEPKDIAKYVARIWSDINSYTKDMSLKCNILSLMRINQLPADSPLKTVFVDAALNLWEEIKKQIDMNMVAAPIETGITAHIATILLHGDLLEKSVEVLQETVKKPHFFIPTIKQMQLDHLFDCCISTECIEAALLVLEYATTLGFLQTTKMGMRLKNLPNFTKNDHDKLIDLLGADVVNMFDTEKS